MGTRTPEREQFLADIFTTAIEGGVNYWACVTAYSPSASTAQLVKLEYADTADERTYDVTLATIARGVGVARRVGLGSLSGREYVKQFWAANRTNGASGDYDADIADQIVQLGLFGKVVYG